MSVLEELLSQQTPRRLPAGLMGRLARIHHPEAIWIIVGLICFGAFYSMMFTALNAPVEIRLGFAVPALVAMIILCWWILGLRAKMRLLVRGQIVEGSLDTQENPPRGIDQIVTVSYTFSTKDGIVFSGTSPVVWKEEFRTRSKVPVCYDPRRPRVHICLLSFE